MKEIVRALAPAPLLALYHRTLAELGAALYRQPSRKLCVIGVTGTKGKTTVTELIAAVLRQSGKRVALSNTIHFVVGEAEERNLYKMTMPGRFFLQRFLRRALEAGCTHAIVEMTSEGALQHRHRGIDLDALVFLNLQPEHLERHGGMEGYANAKLSLMRGLARSPKRPRIMVANRDDAYGPRFLEAPVELRAPYSLTDAEPYSADERGARFVWQGELFSIPLPGVHNIYNALAALTLGHALGLTTDAMKHALEHLPPIAGRAERVERGQPFDVVVDYAHTPDSLRALFEAYKHRRIIALIGSTGGGRDTWNRPQKGAVADEYAQASIITDEDPYDEDPARIAESIARGFVRTAPRIILDRREAIREALREAKPGDAVLITGKGTDPYLMGPRGSKKPWSDRKVAEEELQKLGYN